MENLDKTLETYFGETFGEQARIETTQGDADRLPIFIGQAYDVKRMTLLNRLVYLFFPKTERRKPTPAEVAAHIKYIRKVCGDDFAFVFSELAPYERSRFIQERVPFIVPRRQSYLPRFFMDLREQANSAKNRQFVVEAPQPLSGPAQVLLLYYLQRLDQVGEWSLKKWAGMLGYSTMTATRICDELARCGLCRTETNSKKVTLLFDEDRRALWTQALPHLRSPVLRLTYVRGSSRAFLSWVKAGVSALSRYSMIAEDQNPVLAVTASVYRRAIVKKEVTELYYRDSESTVIEQWRYDPEILADKGVADRLSLYLALLDDRDARVEGALEEMMEGVKWLKD